MFLNSIKNFWGFEWIYYENNSYIFIYGEEPVCSKCHLCESLSIHFYIFGAVMWFSAWSYFCPSTHFEEFTTAVCAKVDKYYVENFCLYPDTLMKAKTRQKWQLKIVQVPTVCTKSHSVHTAERGGGVPESEIFICYSLLKWYSTFSHCMMHILLFRAKEMFSRKIIG